MDTPPTAAPIDSIADWVTAYTEATNHSKQWAETADRCKQHIIDALTAAGANVGTVAGKPAVRWTEVNGNRLDTKKLAAEHPDLIAQFTIPATSRRFTVVKPSNGESA